MKKTILLLSLLLSVLQNYAQTIEELYLAKDYQGLAWLEAKITKTTITGEQSYMLAHAFFQTENDDKAIEYYTNAIAKGFDSSYVYFQKAVSQRYVEQYIPAHQSIDIALSKAKDNPRYLNEKALVYLAQKQYKQALDIFESLKNKPTPFIDAYYWSAYTILQKNERSKALDEFYLAKQKTSPTDNYYLLILDNIGTLEYSLHKDYGKSIKVYQEALERAPNNAEIKALLIKSYNATKDTVKADTLFKSLQNAYVNKELARETMKAQNIIVGDFDWKEQKVIIRKSLLNPVNKSDLVFKVFLMDKAGEHIERKFKVLQTSDQANSPKFQLYEETPYGKDTELAGTWNTPVSVPSLKKQLELILVKKQ